MITVLHRLKKYLRCPLILCLLFGSAQPGANFLACTLRVHDLARTPPEQCRSCGIAPSHRQSACASVKGRPFLPCCALVVPYSSTTEHRLSDAHPPVDIA